MGWGFLASVLAHARWYLFSQTPEPKLALISRNIFGSSVDEEEIEARICGKSVDPQPIRIRLRATRVDQKKNQEGSL